MTSAQLRILEVLFDLAGWACATALRRHGAQPAYAPAMADSGEIQRRTSIGPTGLPFTEYRLAAIEGAVDVGAG
ncbi:MAG: hypothetical protein RLZZ373_3244 [Pseudomonadota bacterium]